MKLKLAALIKSAGETVSSAEYPLSNLIVLWATCFLMQLMTQFLVVQALRYSRESKKR